MTDVHSCVLLFSGGRDSSIAAIRLRNQFQNLILVTVTSDHLVGIDRVHARLGELASTLPLETEWVHVRQPAELPNSIGLAPTCLPCHRDYVTVGARVAADRNARHLAMGYATYQHTWPEQSPSAVARLRTVLGGIGLELHLPVYDIQSKDRAIAELRAAGLSGEAMEQKCSQQIHNATLEPRQLDVELDRWQLATSEALAKKSNLVIEVIDRRRVGDFGGQR